MRQTTGSGAGGPGSVLRRRPITFVFAAIALSLSATVCGSVAHAETVRVTAESAASQAVVVSNAVAAAAERAEAARASVASADAAALPQVSASTALARRSSVPAFALPFAEPGQAPLVLVPDVTTTYAAGLRAHQPLYAGGAIGAGRGVARHERDAVEAARAETVADIRLSAKAAYWEAVRTAASVDTARAQDRRAQRLLSDTQALLDAGMAVNADVLAAKERVASARVAVINAVAAAANALDQLRSLLHVPSDADVELADTLAGPLPPLPPSGDELRSTAMSQRPELNAAAAQIEALAARETLARAPVRPAVAVAAQWEYDRPNQRYFPQLDEFKQSWTVGLAASWTLFDGGKARADLATARARHAAAVEDREELQRRVSVEVQTDLRRLGSAVAAVEAADAARAAATEREEAARDRHAAGLASMAEILDAESELAAAERQQIDSRASAWMASATLDRAVGR
jgi:outer membrane protein